MLPRHIVVTAAPVALLSLALVGCGHRQATGAGGVQGAPSRDSATLAAFVMTTPPSPSPTPGASAPPASSPSSSGAAACASGKDAYGVLVYLVSSDTGTSVQQIASDLRSGRSLDQVAGADDGQVKVQALGLVQSWLQFAQANGKITSEQAAEYRGAAAVVVSGLMAANVSSCVPGGPVG